MPYIDRQSKRDADVLYRKRRRERPANGETYQQGEYRRTGDEWVRRCEELGEAAQSVDWLKEMSADGFLTPPDPWIFIDADKRTLEAQKAAARANGVPLQVWRRHSPTSRSEVLAQDAAYRKNRKAAAA